MSSIISEIWSSAVSGEIKVISDTACIFV